VNEEGTEAAAATALIFMEESCSISVDFVVDHPFVFVLYSTTLHCPLFVGKVMNPKRGI